MLNKHRLRILKWNKLINYRFVFRSKEIINLTSTNNFSFNKFSSNIFQLLDKNFIIDNNFQPETINFWFFLYQQQYFSSLFKLPIIFKTFNSQEVVPKSLLVYMTQAVRLVKWKRYYIMHSNEIIELLFICLWLKNLNLFMDWMRNYFEKTNLKKHRKLFLLLNLLIGKIVWNYNIFLRLKGLRVVLRGKFGKAGSVRKTRKYIRRGKCSYTSKKIGLVNQTNVIRTLTGVFSIKFEVFF